MGSALHVLLTRTWWRTGPGTTHKQILDLKGSLQTICNPKAQGGELLTTYPGLTTVSAAWVTQQVEKASEENGVGKVSWVLEEGF